MSDKNQHKVPPYLAEYWNGEGGERWIRNLRHTEAMLAPLDDILIRGAAPLPGEVVLDVGCGTGASSLLAAQRVGMAGSVLGVDISSVILDVARDNCRDVKNLELKLADAAELDPRDRRFDLILSRLGVMFFADPPAAFSRFRKLLRDSGRIAFVCWAAREDNQWMAVPAAAAFEVLPPPPRPEPGEPGPYSLADREEIRTLLEGAGFRQIEIEPHTGMLDLGTLDAALHLATDMGPAAKPFEEAEPAMAARAALRVREVLEKRLVDGRVRLPFKTWLVTGRAS